MTTLDPSPPPDLLEILRIVREALAPYGAGAADVDSGWRWSSNAWAIEVTPANPAAAPIVIGLDLYGSLSVRVANSRVHPSRNDGMPEWCRSVIENVLAGRVAEIGKSSRSVVRVGPAADAVLTGGEHVPVPWGAGRVRRFSAYCTLPPPDRSAATQ